MKCLIIFGPQAVGKMTVGMSISQKTGYKLMHNHMTIELLRHFFPVGSAPFVKLDTQFRFAIMEEVAMSNLPGFIFTYMFGLNEAGDWEFIKKIETIFGSHGHEVVFLELEADTETRRKRNTTPLRLEHKVSKRDLVESEKRFNAVTSYRLQSLPGEFKGRQHIKIVNDKLDPDEVAEKAITELKL